MLTHHITFGCGAHAAGGAQEQPLPQLALDRGQAFGDCRCGDVQVQGRGTEGAVGADGQHKFKVGAVH